jgi:protein phosphatase
MINMANTRNGHDNSTIALVHCQVKQPVEAGQTTLLQDLPGGAAVFTQPSTLLLGSPESPSGNLDRQQNFADGAIGEANSRSKKPLLFGAIGLSLLIAIGATGWFLSQGKPTATPSTSVSPSPIVSPSEAPK